VTRIDSTAGVYQILNPAGSALNPDETILYVTQLVRSHMHEDARQTCAAMHGEE
jgi:hypothetical protein